MSDIAAVGQEVKKSWGWMLALGALLILCGVACFARPIFAGVTATLFIGWLMIFGGAMHMVNAFAASGFGQVLFRILIALAYGIAGIWLLARPGEGLAMLTLVLGIALIVEGGFTLFSAMALPSFVGKGMMIISAILGIVAGALIWSKWPQSSEVVIGVILGVRLIFAGWSYVWLGLAAKNL